MIFKIIIHNTYLILTGIVAGVLCFNLHAQEADTQESASLGSSQNEIQGSQVQTPENLGTQSPRVQASNLQEPRGQQYKPKSCKRARTAPLKIILNKARIIDLDRNDPELGQVSVVNQNIANVPSPPQENIDVFPINLRQLYLIGKDVGTTHVMLWDDEGCVFKIYDVEVVPDLQNLRAKLHELLPEEKLKIYSSKGAIVLSGEVSNLPNVDAALKLAQGFAGENYPVLNLMQVTGAQQVMLEVKVAEISRTVLKRLGINLTAFSPQNKWGIGAVKGGANFPNADNRIPLLGPFTGRDVPLNPIVGPLIDLFEPATPSIADAGLFAYSISKNFFFSVTIDALKNTGLAKILAEPTLTTLSGQEATFRSGGEFPIPVPQQEGAITIEFKEFGVGVNFLPVVLNSKRINLKLNISVSELSAATSTAVGIQNTNNVIIVPSLTIRSATSTVELADGQAIAIAGLISDKMRDAVNKFPGLGDVPGLGLLFRSQEFQKDQSELVIFVTPRLAQPTPPQQIRLPTEAFVEPSDVEFYLMGKMEGQKKSNGFQLTDPGTQGGGLEGDFGHDL